MPGSLRLHAGVRCVAVVCLLGLWASPAGAQYFGRNKVRYQTFDFKVLKTEHFDVYYYPAEEDGVELAARLAERWRVRLGRLLAHELRGRQPLVLYASHSDFEQTNIIGGELTEGTGGVTESVRRRIVLPMAGPVADTDHVIGHELVHAFQFDMTSGPETAPGTNGASRLPLWFIEGMAEYLSIGPADANTAMWLRDAVQHEKLPAIKDLNDPQYFPYRWGQAFWAYVAGRWGDAVIPRMLLEAARSGSTDAAIEHVLGLKSKDLSVDWQAAIRRTYEPVLAGSTPAARVGRTVVAGREFGAELNLGPALSPDGRSVAFLSERNYFSMDLYVAETATGRITRRLTQTSTDPHYSSIQFIYSAGAWDSTSQRLAIATVTGGQPSIAIFDVASGARIREIPVTGVDEVLNPTWAPDGSALCFTGMTRGLTDLFLVDLATGTLRQLTHDVFAEIQPAWAPDGTRIAFATDRFSSQADTLSFGELRLALIDPASGAVTEVAGFASGKHINPQWSPDGRALYFVSDRDGIANVYRLSLADMSLTQVTTVGTGVSGITRISPALSVAAHTGLIAFSLYDEGRYSLVAVEPTDGHALAQLPADAGVLPPVGREPSEVATLMGNPAFGLPAAQEHPSTDYRPRLSLDSIGQPSVGLGISRFGTSIGGGLSFYMSDMLQDHVLATAIQINSGWNGGFSARNTGGEVVYLNQARRWNWGAIGSRVPYLSGGFASRVDTAPGGDLVETDQLYLFRQTEQGGAGLLAYPLDRARRVELQSGVSRISFDQEVTTQSYSLITGRVYENSTVTTPLARPLTLANSSAAFVFDTTTFGATSPVRGQRYRFEVSPVVGDVKYAGLLADYRRYLTPAPFYTVAVRAMHYGRYGTGGEDPRFYPLYLGQPGLVRGYDAGTVTASECVPTAVSTCPAIDNLLGSRMLVGNVELRFPLLRPFGVSRAMYGPLPVEVGLFADAGVAWKRGETPSLVGGARDGVASAGVAFRVNVLGFLIAELDVVRPFQRPAQGWMFAFNFMPGW